MNAGVRRPGRLRQALSQLRPSEAGLGHWPCPCCGFGWHVRLRRDELAVRCMRCGASAISQSIIDVVRRTCPDIPARQALELSAHGPLARWLQLHAAATVLCEYLPDRPAGSLVDGVRNEDVQQLTLPDQSFDLVTSTEVFEHVADDARGFREIRRVLRPGGVLVFTVPLLDVPGTHERAKRVAGGVVHLDTPEYHGDAFTGSTRVLCFRNYGRDILDRLHAAGFGQASLSTPGVPCFGYARQVVVAHRDPPSPSSP